MHPIEILVALVIVILAWIFFTQILIPAFDSRLPMFPWFRKSRYEQSMAMIAAEDLEKARDELFHAQNALKIHYRVNLVTPAYSAKEKALHMAIMQSKIALKDAEERVSKFTKEPKEAKKDDSKADYSNHDRGTDGDHPIGDATVPR